MEAAVTTVLADFSAYSVGRVWRPVNLAGLQAEPEDRSSGRRRSPQRRNLWQPQVKVKVAD